MIEICLICNCTAHGVKNQELSFYLIKNMKPKIRKLWLASVDKPRECRSLCYIKDTTVLSTARVYNRSCSCIQPKHSVHLASRYHSINNDIRYNLWRYASYQRVNNVYVFGIGDLSGRKVGQVTTHAQSKWRTILFPPSLKLIWPSAAEFQRFCLLIGHVTWWPWPLTFWP